MLICIAMMVATLWMPSLLGALAHGYGLDVGALSRLASAELVGFLLGSAFTSSRSLERLRGWVFAACAVLVACNLALAAFELPFTLVRPLAGLASGVGFGYGLKLCALSERPTRYFGIVTGLMSLTMIAGFQGIAWLIAAAPDVGSVAAGRSAAHGVFVVYAVLALVAAGVHLLNRPAVSVAANAPGTAARSAFPPLAIVGLLAIVISFTGQGGTWAFLQLLGVAHGFPVAEVANAMSAFAVLGIAGSFAAAAVPARMPRWIVIAAALVVLWLGLYALHAPRSITWYVLGCAIGGFYWNFILPLILGLLAAIEPSGRASVLGGTMSSAGSALGPLLAGALIHESNYRPVGWMTGIACLLGLLAVLAVETRRASPARAASPAR
jgi:predicted MFS family arabinose efflux permease